MHAAVLAAVASVCPAPTDYALAESLIRDPAAATDTGFPFRERVAARVVAERLEIAGPGVWLDWDGGGVGVYYALNQTLRELADCPPLAAALRLPPMADCTAAWEFNRAYAEAIRARKEWEVDRADRLEAAAAEIDVYVAFWGAAADAQHPSIYVECRRRHLRTCRDMIGREAWGRNEFPDFTTGRFSVPR